MYQDTCVPIYLYTFIPTHLHTYVPTYLHTYIPVCLQRKHSTCGRSLAPVGGFPIGSGFAASPSGALRLSLLLVVVVLLLLLFLYNQILISLYHYYYTIPGHRGSDAREAQEDLVADRRRCRCIYRCRLIATDADAATYVCLMPHIAVIEAP